MPHLGYNPDQKPPYQRFANIVDSRVLEAPSRSRIQLSLKFLLVVIVCNAVKLATILWVLLVEKDDFVVMLGDGATSYLRRPDPTTEKFCVYSKDAIISTLDQSQREDAGGRHEQLDNVLLRANNSWKKHYHAYSSSLDRDRELGSSFM